jgi:hypothetical protein
MCKECGKPINSDSIIGDRCILYLLDDGLVIESMQGEYDSYGRVFDENRKSIEWKMHKWEDVCDLMFHKNKNNGIAAVHEDCFTGVVPETRSDDDPNQGWGPIDAHKKG